MCGGWVSSVVHSQQRGALLHVVNSYSRERASSAELQFESMRPSFHMLRRRNRTRCFSNRKFPKSVRVSFRLARWRVFGAVRSEEKGGAQVV